MHKHDNLIKHGSIMLAATLAGGITNYLYHFFMIRMLTPADYGVLYSLLALFMIIGVPIGTISIVITKYVAKYKGAGEEKKLNLLFERSLKILSFFGVGIIFIFAALCKPMAAYLKIESVTPVMIIGCIVALTFIGTVTAGTLQGLQYFIIMGIVGLAGALAKVAFGVILVELRFGVNGALFGVLLSIVFGLVIAFFPLKKLFTCERDGATVIDKREILRYLVPVGIAIFCFGFLTYYDAIIVKHYFLPAIAGYYSTCALIGKAFLFPPMAFSGALLPKASETHAAGKKPTHLLNKSLIMNVAFLLIGVAICVSIPKFLINVLMKGKNIAPDNYKEMVMLMRVFGIMVIPYGLLHLLINYNLALHRSKFLYVLVCGAALLVGSLLLFHSSLLQVMFVFGGIGYLIFLANLAVTYLEKGVKVEGVQREDIYLNAGVQ